MSIKAQMQEKGITLPELGPPLGNYVHAVQTGNLLFLSGKGPVRADGSRPVGVVGREVSLEQAYQDARSCGLYLLAAAEQHLGSLDKVTKVVKVLGMVRADPDFEDQPKVINGCSDLFVEVFGQAGRHARSAVGMGSLPSGITVEIEAIFEVQ